MSKLTRINDFKVQPLPDDVKDTRPIRGSFLFALLCSVIYMFAKKGKGKTTVIANILKEICGPETIIVVFVPTYHVCKTWAKIRKWIQETGHPVLEFTGFKDEDGNDQLDMLTKILKLPLEERLAMMYNGAAGNSGDSDKTETKEGEPHPFAAEWAKYCISEPIGRGEKIKKKKEKRILTPAEQWLRYRAKLKHQPLDFVFIMDDMGKGLRTTSFANFMKTQRHFTSKIIIAAHDLKDLQPDQRQMVDYWLLFGGIPEKELEDVYTATRVSIPYANFSADYAKATTGKRDFLYVDNENTELRKNFDEQFDD